MKLGGTNFAQWKRASEPSVLLYVGALGRESLFEATLQQHQSVRAMLSEVEAELGSPTERCCYTYPYAVF